MMGLCFFFVLGTATAITRPGGQILATSLTVRIRLFRSEHFRGSPTSGIQ
jgi:hypothetical protein